MSALFDMVLSLLETLLSCSVSSSFKNTRCGNIRLIVFFFLRTKFLKIECNSVSQVSSRINNNKITEMIFIIKTRGQLKKKGRGNRRKWKKSNRSRPCHARGTKVLLQLNVH